jgi:Protein of unknown function (DUF998)
MKEYLMSSYRPGTDSRKLTQSLLICGITIAPLFFAVVIIQSFTRAGFDIRRAPLSLLSLGDLRWIQIANFIITGLLALACAIGIRRALAGSKGGTWGPLLIATYGLGLILAGTFHPDSGYGFPPNAPAGALATMSGHATVHYVAFAIVVISLIAACFVFFRTFRSLGQHGWSIYSVATGIIAPVLLGVGFTTNTILALTVMAAIAFGWLSAVAARLYAELQQDKYTSESGSMEPSFPGDYELIPMETIQ